jgi:hypothetical protein
MGIDGIHDSDPGVSTGATPDNDPTQDEARISDVPYIGDGFHAGGCRLYENDPQIVAARSAAYKKMQARTGVFAAFLGRVAERLFLSDRVKLPKFLTRWIEKIRGNNNEPPSASSGGSGTTTGTKPASPAEISAPNAARFQIVQDQQMQQQQALAAGGSASLLSLNVFFNPVFMCQWLGNAFVNPVFLSPVKVF